MELSPALRSLPGVIDATRLTQHQDVSRAAGPSSVRQAEALVFEGTSPSRASTARQQILEEDFAADVKANPDLTAALRAAGMPADPRGLARVANSATRAAEPFRAVVEATRNVVAALGRNPIANAQLAAAQRTFVSTASLPANNRGDLMYILTRVATAEANSDAQVIRDRINQQVAGNNSLLAAMRAYEESLVRAHEQLQSGGTKQVTVVESDFRLNAANQVERVADAQPEQGTKLVPEQGTKLAPEQATKNAAAGPEGDSAATKAASGTKAVAGAEVPGVVDAADQPAHKVVMNAQQLEAEILETRAQIQALANANQSLKARIDPPPGTFVDPVRVLALITT